MESMKTKQPEPIEARSQAFLLATAATLEDLVRQAAELARALETAEGYAASRLEDDEHAPDHLAYILHGALSCDFEQLAELAKGMRRDGRLTERALRAQNDAERRKRAATPVEPYRAVASVAADSLAKIGRQLQALPESLQEREPEDQQKLLRAFSMLGAQLVQAAGVRA